MSVQEFQATTTTIPVVSTAYPPAPVPAPTITVVEEKAPAQPLITRDTLALGVVVCAALVTHAFNMFNYPLYRQDEGIVGQQAFALLNGKGLSPYTYNYDHPPVATFMMALWTLITGGFHTFGASINSGRVFMVALSLGSTFFLYRIARELTKSTGGALVASLFFSLSPLAIRYQRLVVVDNFMVFWLLAALYFAICNRGRLFYFFLASFAFGFAFNSRETALLFLPGFLILMYVFSDRSHRLFAIWGGALISFVVVLQFFLYAVFKSELFPDRFNFQGELDGTATHVSLFGTLYQNYHTIQPLWGDNQGFGITWQTWQNIDSLLILAGFICAVVNLLFGFRRKENWVAPIMMLCYGALVLIGGVDVDYMIVAFVPFLAIAIGQTLGWAGKTLGPLVGSLTIALVLAGAGYLYIATNTALYTADVNFSFGQALSWIKGNITPDRSLIINDALWVDLHTNYEGPVFNRAESHWKANNDPAVRVKEFAGDYKNVDFVVLDEEMRQQFKDRGLTFNQQALTNSSLVRQFDGPNALQIRKVNNQNGLMNDTVLTDGYAYYKGHFISAEGRVTDGQGKTTAEMQATALTEALWNNDQTTFDKVWVWTARNLQLENNLFRSDTTLEATRSTSPANSYTNARADIEIAQALILADRRWKDQNYIDEANYILKGVWENEVVNVHGHYYLKASALAAAQQDTEVLLNMGAFQPQAIALFKTVDTKHDWKNVYESGYALLNKASWYGRGDYQDHVGLPPGLLVMNTDTEELRAVAGKYGQKLGDFDEEAQQSLWGVALDYKWNHSSQAKDYIHSAGWYMISYWQKNQMLPGAFTSDGLPISETQSLGSYAVASSYAGVLDELQIEEKRARGESADLNGSSSATEIMARAFMGDFFRKSGQGYWLRPDNLQDQEWGWLATANHLNRLNLNFENLPAHPELAVTGNK